MNSSWDEQSDDDADAFWKKGDADDGDVDSGEKKAGGLGEGKEEEAEQTEGNGDVT